MSRSGFERWSGQPFEGLEILTPRCAPEGEQRRVRIQIQPDPCAVPWISKSIYIYSDLRVDIANVRIHRFSYIFSQTPT